jgi:hypothetical protein
MVRPSAVLNAASHAHGATEIATVIGCGHPKREPLGRRLVLDVEPIEPLVTEKVDVVVEQ